MSIIDQLYGEGKTSPRKSSILDKVYNEQTPEQAYEAERQGLAAISGEMPGAAWRGMQGAYLNLGNLGRKLVGADTSENDAILAQLQAERDALKAKYGDNFAFDFAEGVGGMGGTIPLDIATGGISKALLVPRLISKALPYMERIPGFALGMMGRMGAEGSVKQVPDPGSLASSLERTLNTVTGGAEGLAEGILYGRAGEIGAEGNIVSRLAKQVPTQGLLGGSMAAYEAAKEGRLPTEGELARGAGFGAGLGAGFATIGGRRERQRPGIIDANEYRQRLAGLLDEENLPPTIQDFPPGAIAGGSGQSILRSLPGGAVEGVAGQSVPRSFPGARAGGSGQSEFLRIPPGAKEGGSGQEAFKILDKVKGTEEDDHPMMHLLRNSTLRATVGGAWGVEQDDEGNWKYNPQKGLIGALGGGLMIAGVRTYTPAFKANLIKWADKAGYATKADMERYMKSADSVYKDFLKKRDLLDTEEVPDLFTAVNWKYNPQKGPNSDPIYKRSLDFSTLCKKRHVMTSTIDAIQTAIGRGLTAEEYLEVRNALKEKGYTVSCGPCYVESKRMHMGNIINDFIESHPEADRNLFLSSAGIAKMKATDPALYKEFNRKITAATMSKAMETYAEFKQGNLTDIPQSAVDRYNAGAGFRIFSWSDFEMQHLLDGMQAIGEMAVKGLKAHAYTKVPAFADLFGKTGIKINMSLIPQGIDKNGKIIWDDVEGMPYKQAIKLREKYPDTCGTVAIATSDEMITAMLKDPTVDFIIPYHASGMSKVNAAKAGMEGWQDYTKVQHENFKPEVAKKILEEVGEDKKAYNKELENRRSEVGWYKIGQDVEAYKAKCEELGLTPKFAAWKDDPNYWKLLVDHKHEHDGRLVGQNPVRPDFDQATLNKYLREFKSREPQSAVKSVVNQFVKVLGNERGSFSTEKKKEPLSVPTLEDSPGTTLYANPLQPLISGVGNMVKGVLDKMVAPAIGGMPGESFGHTFTRTVQNSMLGLKDWEDSVAKRTGQTIDKAQSAYFTEERMHGKIADKIEAMDRGYVQPFIKLMAETSKNLNTSLDEFDLFLKARYARTGNAIIEKRNPDLYAKGGTRHGMTNDQADQLLAQFKAEGKTKAFENLAKIIYQMQDFKLKLIEKYGLETPEIIQSMRDTHGEYYVPAKGKSGEPSLPGKGAGLDIKSSGLKAALGRMSPSENSIIHTINDLEATIRRVHQAEVGQKFLDLVEKYPDPGIEVNKVQLAQRYNPTTGEVETYNKPVFGPEDTTFSGIKDGKHFYIRINDNPLLVRALKSDQIPQGTLEQLISRCIAPATRTIAGLVTKWSPSFAARNPIRDAMDAIQGVASETKAKMAAEAVTGIPQSAAAMYRYFRGRGGTGAYDRYAKEFAENGGMVGFYSGKDYDAQLKNLESMIRRESATGVRGYSSRTTKAIFDAVEDFTGAGENGTRLSVYKTLRENGWSVEDAVSYAKNITINFNRHGEHRWISQLYMFANPGIQGVKRFKDVVTTKKGAYIMGGITATALALAEANRMMGGQDEDGTFNYDKLSPFEKSRNLILMNPATGKPLVKIPLGFYARLPFAIANSVADVRHGVAGPVKFATNVIDTALDAFNPLGAGNTLQTFTPTIARPAVDIYTNKNFMGIPIKPEQPTFGPQKPESELYFKGVSPYSKAATQKLNELTGGNAMRSGFIDISPETVDYTVKFFTGGPGDTIYKMAALAGKFYDTDGQPFTKANLQRMWEETTAQEVPVVGGFTGAKTEHYYPTKFREASQEAEQRFGEYKWRGKTDQGVDEYAEKEGDVIGMGQVSAKYKSQIADINAAIKEIEADKTLSREEMRKQKKELEKEKEDLMKQYLKDYNEADKQRKAYKPKKAGGGI